MIVVDSEDAKLTLPDGAVERLDGRFGSVQLSPQPVPSYHITTTTTSTTPLLPPPPPPSYPKYPTPAPHTPVVIVHYRQSPAKRFWRAFALALLIYFAVLTLIRSIVHMASGGARMDDSVGVPMREDGKVLESIGALTWTSYHPHPRWAPGFSDSAETSFELPVASQELYLISRGSYQGGKVQVTQSIEQADTVRVDVRVAYHDQRALARATVCRLRKGGNRNGVGIYTPTGWSNPSRDRLSFEVVFTFPAATSADAPLRINEFTLLTSNFAYTIDDLWRSIVFENMELNTSNAPIRIDAITLTKGSLTSSNSPIVGHFNASNSLSLHTSNGHIQATASLFNAGRESTKLDMRTSNGPITSSVSLTTDSGVGGDFVVKSRTSNGAIKLQYDDAPLRARLFSDVRTSNGPASVVMHPTFEGTYEVATSNSRPIVVDTHPTDPSGAGRVRVVEQKTTSRSVITGRVFWALRGGAVGSCTVHTSNSRASLDV